MKKLFYSIAAVVAAAFISIGCTEEVAPVNGAAFDIESYNDFWWKKYTPDTLKFVINTEFKECSLIRRSLVLALCENDAKGTIVPTDVAQVYVAGKPAEGNKITVPVLADETSEIEIGVVVAREYLAEDAVYNWHIKLCDDAGLTRVLSKDQNGAVNPVDKSNPWMLGMDVCVNNNHVTNSLKKGVILSFLSFIIACVLWILLSRFVIWRSINFSKMYIDYGDGYGAKPVATRGCYELICTNDPRAKDSTMSKILKGKRMYEVNDFWTEPVTIKCSSKYIEIKGAGNYGVIGEKRKGEPFTLVNPDGKKAEIETT